VAGRRVCTETIPSGCDRPLNPPTSSGQADPHRGCRDAARSARDRTRGACRQSADVGYLQRLPSSCRTYRSASAQGAAVPRRRLVAPRAVDGGRQQESNLPGSV